jgi:hypothetical protein
VHEKFDVKPQSGVENMSKKSRKRNRAKAKATLRNQLLTITSQQPALALHRGPHGGNGPVHVCGTRPARNADGLTPYKRELIREAASLQHCKAQGEVMSSHMIVQETFGWSVHAYNPAMPNHVALDGKIAAIEEATTQPSYSRCMVEARESAQQVQSAMRSHLKSLRSMRSPSNSIEVNADLWGE